MTKKEKEVLAQQLREVSGDIAEIALFLEGDESQTQTATYQEARAVMGEKARTGYHAEVKAVLTKHHLNRLSECKDPSVFAEIIAETEAIGNA